MTLLLLLLRFYWPRTARMMLMMLMLWLLLLLKLGKSLCLSLRNKRHRSALFLGYPKKR